MLLCHSSHNPYVVNAPDPFSANEPLARFPLPSVRRACVMSAVPVSNCVEPVFTYTVTIVPIFSTFCTSAFANNSQPTDSDHDLRPAINSCQSCCVALATSIAPHSVLISLVRVPAMIRDVPGLNVESFVAMNMLLPNTAIILFFLITPIYLHVTNSPFPVRFAQFSAQMNSCSPLSLPTT